MPKNVIDWKDLADNPAFDENEVIRKPIQQMVEIRTGYNFAIWKTCSGKNLDKGHPGDIKVTYIDEQTSLKSLVSDLLKGKKFIHYDEFKI